MQLDVDAFSRRMQAIGACEAVVPLRQATMDALGLFGITRAYYLAPLSRDPRVARIVTNWGLPWAWEKPYRERLHKVDPVPPIALERLAPVVWPDDLPVDQLGEPQRRYLAFAAEQGLGRGIGVACFGPDGRSGFLGGVLDKDAPAPDPLTLERVNALGQKAFQVYCRIVKRESAVPGLSNREMEVLHWMSRGKSNAVIAELLAISPSSVDVYVRRIFAKLDVADRTSASLKAFAQGLLVSDDYERFIARLGEAELNRPGPKNGGPRNGSSRNGRNGSDS